MNDLKIALISHEFPPFNIGGISSYCYDLAYNLATKQIKTRVICGATKGIVGREKVNQFLEIVRLPLLNYPPRYFWFQILNIGKFYDLISDCNIIHAVNPTASFFAFFYKKKYRKTLVTTQHQDELLTLKTLLQRSWSDITFGDVLMDALSYPIDNFFKRTLFNYADKIILPGRTTFNFMKRIQSPKIVDKISIVYNAVNVKEIQLRCRRTKNLKKSDFSIVCVSRLTSLKGVDKLFPHIKILFREFPDVKMKIFGNGPMRLNLLKKINREKLNQNVMLMGHLERDKIIPQINEATVAVFPTLLEVGPFISALEAMACKKPIVVFDLPFNQEFVQNMKTGIMAKAGDVEDFVNKIALLLSNEDLRNKIGRAAYLYVKQHHNWENTINDYIKLYKESLASGLER